MAELEFVPYENGDFGFSVDGFTEGYIMRHADGTAYYIDDSEREDAARSASSIHEYAADELEQIAAKLRELNGEPNTRALDERVREFRQTLEKRVRLHIKRAGNPANDDDGLVLPNHQVANVYIEALRLFNELFPAELKEKLKESEDG